MISADLSTFKIDLSKVLAKAGNNASAIARKIALETYTNVVMKSPVDSGRLRGNWNVGINNVDFTEYPADYGKLGAAPDSTSLIRATTSLSNFKMGDVIWISNNLPYVHKLEYGLYGAGDKTHGGYSKQAPQGFVRITYKEIISNLENIGRKVVK